MTSVVFSDLDGTLLDRDTYSWDAAGAALEYLKRHGVPWVLVTSKTRAEVQRLRRLLDNSHPFVVENGGAAFIPCGYFPAPVPAATLRDGYEVIEWGRPYAELVAGLEAASRISRCRVVAFHEMTAEEVAAACNLPVEEAMLAKHREYDEPFQVIDTERTSELEQALVAQGLRCTRGGRFRHVSGYNDKAAAVEMLSGLFRRVHGRVTTIGLGDALNDLPLLNAVDVPVIVRSPDSAGLMAQIPRARLTEHEGSRGWNAAVLDLLSS